MCIVGGEFEREGERVLLRWWVFLCRLGGGVGLCCRRLGVVVLSFGLGLMWCCFCPCFHFEMIYWGHFLNNHHNYDSKRPPTSNIGMALRSILILNQFYFKEEEHSANSWSSADSLLSTSSPSLFERENEVVSFSLEQDLLSLFWWTLGNLSMVRKREGGRSHCCCTD